MGFLDTFAARLGYVKRKPDTQAPAWLRDLGHVSRWDMPDGAEAEAQGTLYTRLSWIQIAVSASANMAATAAFSVKRRQGEKLRDVPNHPFELRWHRPNEFDSSFEFKVSLYSYRRLNGNAYVWLNKADRYAEPDELFVLPSQCVTPVPDGQLGLAGYMFDSGYGPEIPLQPWEVVHFKSWNPLSRFVGLSPIEAVQLAANGDLFAQQWNANFFGRDNAKVPGALAFRDMVNDPQWKQIKADMREGWASTNRSGPLMLRGVGAGGVDWVPMGMSQTDMQFLQGRQFTKEEIFAMFAPGLASSLDVSATEANATAGKASFIEFGVWPLLVEVSEKLTNDVLPSYDRRSPDSLVATFDDIRPTDRNLELQEQDRAERVMTVDELREKYYQLAPLPNGRGARLLDEPPLRTTDDRRLTTDARLLPVEPLRLPAPTEATKALRGDEAALLQTLAQIYTGANDADLAEALRVSLLAVMAVEVADKLPASIADVPPVYAWIGGFMPLALGLLAGGPGPRGDDFISWLGRKVVHLVTEAKAWAVERLADWLNGVGRLDAAPDVYEPVWKAVLDGNECKVCLHLHGTPKRLLPPETKPGALHPFCRCEWQLAVVDTSAIEAVESVVSE